MGSVTDLGAVWAVLPGLGGAWAVTMGSKVN